jgi:hypothetical protein
MAEDAVEIVNMALSHLGNSAVIEDIDELSAEARQGKLWYEAARREALEALNWNFARRRIALSLHSEPPPEGQWHFRYQYPADCLKARFIVNPLGPQADPVPFEIEMVEDERTILVDLDEARLIYTRDHALVSSFSPMFVNALAFLLASKLATALTGSVRKKELMMQAFGQAMYAAIQSNAGEGTERRLREAEWTRERD